MTFELFCATLIALLVGLAVCFNGYRLFLILLPIWGFFFGFALGAETMQALFGVGFLSTVTSWVVGFIFGAVFAVLSYLFYIVGVALFAASLGYALGVGLMGAIGIDLGIISWLVGIVLAVVVAAATILLNIQKWVIIVATALGGAAVIVGTLIFGVQGLSRIQDAIGNPFRAALADSPLWLIFFLVLAVLGFVAQLRSTQKYTLEEPEPPF